MAYLSPHFEWDIFVSYAHGVAPSGGEPPLKIWSRAFIEALKTDILNLSSNLPDLQIWYDRNIDPTAKLTQELRGIVQGSGILLILISNRYLDSIWCNDERAWFEDQIKQRADDVSRTFVVRVQATAPERWPTFLLDERGHAVIGFQFHPKPEAPEDDVEPYGWPDLAHRSEEFRAEFAKLRTTICRRLRDIKKRADAPSQSTPSTASMINGRRPRIYLHGANDDANLRNQVEGVLTGRSFEVVSIPSETGGTLATWSEQSRKHVAFAKRCDALALIRDPRDDEFDIELLDIADDHERITRERGSPLPWAVLDAKGQNLPPFATSRGAARFDLNDVAWSDRLGAWLRGADGSLRTFVL